eukprot:16797-Lingulodinium_polyedra.AAC.1
MDVHGMDFDASHPQVQELGGACQYFGRWCHQLPHFYFLGCCSSRLCCRRRRRPKHGAGGPHACAGQVQQQGVHRPAVADGGVAGLHGGA